MSDREGSKVVRTCAGLGAIICQAAPAVIGVRLQSAALDRWILHQPDDLSRPEAVRMILREKLGT